MSGMGSYGDRWSQCSWCCTWGKCCHDDLLQGAERLHRVRYHSEPGYLCEWCLDFGWLQCSWCWTWGKHINDDNIQGAWPLYTMDGIGVMCGWCYYLEEPAWRPNNRKRFMQYLLLGRVLPPKIRMPEVAHAMAVFLAKNMP